MIVCSSENFRIKDRDIRKLQKSVMSMRLREHSYPQSSYSEKFGKCRVGGSFQENLLLSLLRLCSSAAASNAGLEVSTILLLHLRFSSQSSMTRLD